MANQNAANPNLPGSSSNRQNGSTVGDDKLYQLALMRRGPETTPGPQGPPGVGVGTGKNHRVVTPSGVYTAFALRAPIQIKRDRRICLNVGGQVHETMLSCLCRVPGTRLSQIAELQEKDPSYQPSTKQYFFDRNPTAFAPILHYCRSGELHVDESLCGNVFKKELEFWGLPETEIEPCCWSNYSRYTSHKDTLRALDENFYAYEDDFEDAIRDKSPSAAFQLRLWKTVEDPSFSFFARIFAFLSMFVVIVSILSFVIGTYPLVRKPVDQELRVATNLTECLAEQACREEYIRSYNDTDLIPIMDYIDYACTGYFTVELVFRFIVCPQKLEFIKHPLNIIDFLVVVPMLASITMRNIDMGINLQQTAVLLKVFMILRIARLLRIFKLMKHYSAFKVLVYTVKVSTKELLLMVVFLFTAVLIFGSVIHFAETVTFQNIPIALWWALVTMTTVGYGDIYPTTTWGYAIGCICVICGVLVIAFTVPIVVNNFTLYYSHAQSRISLPPRKRNQLKAWISPEEGARAINGVGSSVTQSGQQQRFTTSTTSSTTVQKTQITTHVNQTVTTVSDEQTQSQHVMNDLASANRRREQQRDRQRENMTSSLQGRSPATKF